MPDYLYECKYIYSEIHMTWVSVICLKSLPLLLLLHLLALLHLLHNVNGCLFTPDVHQGRHAMAGDGPVIKI